MCCLLCVCIAVCVRCCVCVCECLCGVFNIFNDSYTCLLSLDLHINSIYRCVSHTHYTPVLFISFPLR